MPPEHRSIAAPTSPSARSPRDFPGGRHELGQNFLVDRQIITTIARLVADLPGPIVEFGPGDGALTLPVSASGRTITAVELDSRRVQRLQTRLRDRDVTVVQADFLHHPLPDHPHILLGNIPFHLTTALLRRILPLRGWSAAVLLVQWEVARRRAAIGGATLLTASWWPWYEFSLHARVPARAFRPVPGVDGGLLRILRRPRPLIDTSLSGYQRFVSRVFTGPGRGLGQILPRAAGVSPDVARTRLRELGLSPSGLPRDLNATQWVALWNLAAERQDRARRTPPRPGGKPLRKHVKRPR